MFWERTGEIIAYRCCIKYGKLTSVRCDCATHDPSWSAHVVGRQNDERRPIMTGRMSRALIGERGSALARYYEKLIFFQAADRCTSSGLRRLSGLN